MRGLLDTTVRHLEKLGRNELLARLQPGLSPSDVRNALSRVGLRSSDDLVERYGWRNGTHVPAGTLLDDIHFFPRFLFPVT